MAKVTKTASKKTPEAISEKTDLPVKKNLFLLCDGEGTAEALISTTMNEQEVDEAWDDYYWSTSYKNYREFIDKMKKKGKTIDLVDAVTVIKPC